MIRKRKMGIQRLQRQPICQCQNGLDLGCSVPVAHRGPGPPKPLVSGKRFRNTKKGCLMLLTQESGMEFWTSQSCTVFALLKPLALDLLAMPASQAFAERVFSVTCDLSSGCRNRARTTLERSAFLKVNKD